MKLLKAKKNVFRGHGTTNTLAYCVHPDAPPNDYFNIILAKIA